MSHAEPTITATFLGKTFVFPISSLSIEVQKGLYEEMMMTDKQREERDKKRKESEVGCSSCPDCENTYTQKQIDDGEIVPCNRCYKCFVGECGKDNCNCEFEEEKPVEDKVGEILTRLRVLKEEKPETYKLLNERFCKETNAKESIDEMTTRLGAMKGALPEYYHSLNQLWEEHKGEPVKDEECPKCEAKTAYENTTAMEAYINARMNYVMREEQEEYGNNPNYGGRDFTFVRKNGWDAEEFDNLLCALCERIEKKLNSYNAIFGVGATLESSRNWKRKPKMNEDGHDRHWIVGVCWGVNEEDPFEELYEEDSDLLSDDEDEEDDE